MSVESLHLLFCLIAWLLNFSNKLIRQRFHSDVVFKIDIVKEENFVSVTVQVQPTKQSTVSITTGSGELVGDSVFIGEQNSINSLPHVSCVSERGSSLPSTSVSSITDQLNDISIVDFISSSSTERLNSYTASVLPSSVNTSTVLQWSQSPSDNYSTTVLQWSLSPSDNPLMSTSSSQCANTVALSSSSATKPLSASAKPFEFKIVVACSESAKLSVSDVVMPCQTISDIAPPSSVSVNAVIIFL